MVYADPSAGAARWTIRAMQQWTADRVTALAPDAAAASAGMGLASTRKWSGTGRSERAVWGLCQGSGKDPYQTRVDLSEPAFKCSCPSRKFPCKHGLALMFLLAKDASVFKGEPEPGWVVEWIEGRAGRAEKKVERVKSEKPVDMEAQAKRAAQRELRVGDGIASCRVWLEDLIRRGLAAAQSERAATWEHTAARMVDAQAPGLASFIRRVPEVMASGAGWETRTLDLLGRLHLLLCAGERVGELPADVASDVKAALGFAVSKEEVLAGTTVSDRWVTLGQVVEEEERLRVRRTWLVGRQTGRRALVLDFAAGLQPLAQSIAAGIEFDGDLAFYPGRLPLRALVAATSNARGLEPALGGAADATIETGLRRYAEALGANPWTLRWPLVLSGVRLAEDRDRWYLADSRGDALPLRASFAGGLQLWRLLSVSGGDAMTMLAEWDGEHALPLSAVSAEDGAYYDLAPRWAS